MLCRFLKLSYICHYKNYYTVWLIIKIYIAGSARKSHSILLLKIISAVLASNIVWNAVKKSILKMEKS